MKYEGNFQLNFSSLGLDGLQWVKVGKLCSLFCLVTASHCLGLFCYHFFASLWIIINIQGKASLSCICNIASASALIIESVGLHAI